MHESEKWKWSRSVLSDSYLYANIPFVLSLPPTPHATSLGHHRALSWAPCVIWQSPTSYLLYTGECIYVSATCGPSGEGEGGMNWEKSQLFSEILLCRCRSYADQLCEWNKIWKVSILWTSETKFVICSFSSTVYCYHEPRSMLVFEKLRRKRAFLLSRNKHPQRSKEVISI